MRQTSVESTFTKTGASNFFLLPAKASKKSFTEEYIIFTPGVFSKSLSKIDINLSIKNKEDNQPTIKTNVIATKNPNPVTLGICPLTAINFCGKRILSTLGKKLSTQLNKLTTTQMVTPMGASTITP